MSAVSGTPPAVGAPALPRIRIRVDVWFVGSILAMTGAVTAAAVIALQHHALLWYADAASHVMIPRRVLDNQTPGFAQLGVSWPPLLHVLELPFVRIDALYRVGASGTIVSGLASVATGIFVYRLARLVGARSFAAFLAVLLLIAAPSFLYASVVPMQYAVVMAAATGSIYFLTRWAITSRWTSLVMAGLFLTLTTLAHFDTWPLIPLEFGVVLLVSWRSRVGRKRIQANTLLWALAGLYGIGLFLLFNITIFKDPLQFARATNSAAFATGSGAGQFAAGHAAGHAAGGGRSLLQIARDVAIYPYAVSVLAGLPLAIGGVVGGGLYAFRWRRDVARLVPLLLFYPIAFYTMYALARGSLIHVGSDISQWHNLRYASTMFPALAFFLAIGVRWQAVRIAAAGLAVAVAVIAVRNGDVAAWTEAKDAVPGKGQLHRAARWFEARATTSAGAGPILIPFQRHDIVQVDRFELYTNLPSFRFIDANDSRLWHEARMHPRSAGVKWIVWLGPAGAPAVGHALNRAGLTAVCYAQSWPQPLRIWAVGGFGRGPGSAAFGRRTVCSDAGANVSIHLGPS